MTINFAIYTSAPIPFSGPAPDPTSPDAGVWSPLSCTLIYTPKSALLVDCPTSIAGTNELSEWIAATLPKGCSLDYFIPTHAHGDHFFGFPELQSRFPSVRPIASSNVVAGIEQQYDPERYDSVWKRLFPDTPEGYGIPEKKSTFEPLPDTNVIQLDGHSIQVIDVGHGDTHAASFIHVADLELVVAGDIVYNRDCHQFLGEANDAPKRRQWLEALDRIGQYNAKIIVPGHTFKPSTTADKSVADDMLAGTKEYILTFEEELSKAADSKDLFNTIRAKYSSRWNLFILNFGCEAGFTAKQ